MEKKLDKRPEYEIGRADKITSSGEMRKYVKDLEKIIGESKIKKVKSKIGGDFYVTQKEYEKYIKTYKKALVKTENFENQIRKQIRKNNRASAYSNLTTLLEKSRVTNISYIRSRKEFLGELEKLLRVIRKDFYKTEIGHYKRSYLKAARDALKEMYNYDKNSLAVEAMKKVVERIERMHFRKFYQNYYSGKLRDIKDIYEWKLLLKNGREEEAVEEAEAIYKGLM